MSAPIELQVQPPWAEEERARADHYALVARLFQSAPDAALLAALAQAGRTLGGSANQDGEGGEDALPRAWAALGAASALGEAAVRDEFDALFISVGKPAVMLNASWYLTGFLQEEPLADLRDDLARLGLGRRAGVSETEDHVAALAEVMRHLVVTGPDEAGLARQQAFFEQHLSPWYARLADALERAEGAHFYAKASGLLRAFLDIERAAFDMMNTDAR